MKKRSQILSETILQRNPDQLYSIIDDMVVMLNLEHEEYLNLNSHASYIWQQLKTPRTFGELITRLCIAFDVKEEECIKDTQGFIQDFVDKNIIQIIHETS